MTAVPQFIPPIRFSSLPILAAALTLGACAAEVGLDAEDFESKQTSRPWHTARAITYNIANMAWQTHRTKHTLPQISSVLNNRAPRPDLVLIQEDFFRTDLFSLNPSTYPFQSNPDGAYLVPIENKSGDGLNRFSSWRFEAHKRHDWEKCGGELWQKGGGADCGTRKGFTYAKHYPNITGGIPPCFEIYNVHFDAGERAYDTWVRTLQADQLVRAINHPSRPSLGCAVLVGGDFNLSPSDYQQSPTIIDEIARRTALRDAATTLGTELVNGKNTNNDRFLYGSGANAEIVPVAVRKLWDPKGKPEAQRFSDHEAVELEFTWRSLR